MYISLYTNPVYREGVDQGQGTFPGLLARETEGNLEIKLQLTHLPTRYK